MVRVPLLVDDDLLGADGDGTSLVVGVQTVFSQVDSVGAAAAWPQKNRVSGELNIIRRKISPKVYADDDFFFFNLDL